jgi:hypothetical protein
MELGDDVGDRIADAGDVLEPVFLNESRERLGLGGQTLGGAQVRARAVRVAARESSTRPYSTRSLATSAAPSFAMDYPPE